MEERVENGLEMSETKALRCIFVTGGAGYVGSHTILELLNSGYDVIAIDNFVNAIPGQDGMPESLSRVQKLAKKSLTFYKADLQDKPTIREIFSKVMREFGVKRIIFSSSATVYGIPKYLPIDENHPVGLTCTNPYGRTKYFIEEIMKDVTKSEKGWKVILLRYFNPVGAHESGLIGEDPQGIPNNLMPFIAQVAIGRRTELEVFGNDFNTTDGTGVRDYIHVMDLAAGHVAALTKMTDNNFFGCKAYNLGTGCGYSVLDVIHNFEKATDRKIPYRIVGRRTGDVDSLYADPSIAKQELKWEAKRDLLQMCIDTWHWQSMNPLGFSSPESENKIS
ncbi:UDP-glucose 4-epimerase-like isoform X3 [Centruroides vittatus]|uniref:UDP-glucose 4-epimerase-like isoform X3 n=1 Tax=Centruroides vittatus TaxID=120091 RepID=UPI00350EDF99